jgi:hypothetical protein
LTTKSADKVSGRPFTTLDRRDRRIWVLKLAARVADLQRLPVQSTPGRAREASIAVSSSQIGAFAGENRLSGLSYPLEIRRLLLGPQDHQGDTFIVTARDMTNDEKRIYRRKAR